MQYLAPDVGGGAFIRGGRIIEQVRYVQNVKGYCMPTSQDGMQLQYVIMYVTATIVCIVNNTRAHRE